MQEAVPVVLIHVSKCKEIPCEQVDRLGSLECATTALEVSKSHHNRKQASIQKSKNIKFNILLRYACTALTST